MNSMKVHWNMSTKFSLILFLFSFFSIYLLGNERGNVVVDVTEEHDAGEESEVAPLLGDIAFSQFSPYNDKCPLYDGKRTATGCLATAMAQIMAYYRYPQTMIGGNIEYVSEQYSIPVYWNCSTTVFDWNNILDTYNADFIPNYPGSISTTAEQYLTFATIQSSTQYYHFFEIYQLVSITQEVISGELQLLLADDKGNIIRPVGRVSIINELKPRAGWSSTFIRHSMPYSIADGTYRLYLGFKFDNDDNWSVVQRAVDETSIYNSDREEFYITITKTGLYYSIDNESFVCGYSDSQGNAVATLCAACGAASHMNYGTDGSDANNDNLAWAMIDYMDYDNKMCLIQSSMNTTSGWLENIVQEELKKNRPVYCCTSLENGGSHAVVIDGFKYIDNTPYFHVNWGKNGEDNGYYLLDNMITSSGKQFGFRYSLIMGIKPNDSSDIGFTFTAKSVYATYENQVLSLSIESFLNSTYKVFYGDIIVYAINKDGNEYVLDTSTWDLWEPLKGYGKFERPIQVRTDIKDGDYNIVIRCKERGSVVERDILTTNFPNVYITGNSAGLNNIGMDDDNGIKKEIYDLSGRKVQNKSYRNSIMISNGKTIIISH